MTSHEVSNSQGAVTGDDPGGSFVDGQVTGSVFGGCHAALVILYASGPYRSFGQVGIQVTDGVPEDIAVHFLINSGKETIRAVGIFGSPTSLVAVAGAF